MKKNKISMSKWVGYSLFLYFAFLGYQKFIQHKNIFTINYLLAGIAIVLILSIVFYGLDYLLLKTKK